MPRLWVGCSGFMYDHWRGVFYPDSLNKRQWLRYYCSVFNTVELNVTFYRLPSQDSFLRWYSLSPEGFGFSVKGSRYITHVKRLRQPEEALERFMQRALVLGQKLQITLWQFPPEFQRDIDSLRSFVKLLKRYNTRAAFEFRNRSWITDETTQILSEAGFCYCLADWPEFNASLPETTGYIYIRRHGHGGSYNTCYSRAELERDAEFIGRQLQRGFDVYVYFNNDAYGYAPRNALELLEIMREYEQHPGGRCI